jgi:hypothetical protein
MRDQTYARRQFNMKKKSALRDILASFYAADFDGRLNEPTQRQAVSRLNFDFANLYTLHITQSLESVETITNEFLPFNSTEVLIGYAYQTALPTSFQYSAGPYYHGALYAWSAIATPRLGPRFALQVESDKNTYDSVHSGESSVNEWLNRASLDYQLGRNVSVDVGVREIIGPGIPNAYSVPSFAFQRSENVTFAAHYLKGSNEVYLTYGDPNSVSTVPTVILKIIRYIGAEKGT